MGGVTTGCEVYNLGTGKGTSVLEMVAAFEKASGKVCRNSPKLLQVRSWIFLCKEHSFFLVQKIPIVLAGRRPGDAEIVYASTAKAERELNWK